MNKQRKPWAKKPSGDRSPSARRLAGRILRRVVNGQGTVRDQLAWSFAETPPAPRDEGLVTELVYGSVRHLRTLDHVLAALSRRPLEDIDETALIQLRLGVYQWLFLERIPPHAIVNEAVSLIGHAGAKKFVNGLLRGLGRLLVERVPEAPLERPRSELLTTANGTWLFSKPIFPEEQLPWLAVTSGQPLDYIERLVERHGLEKAIAVCRANNQSPSLVLRVNPLRAERLEVLATLAAEGVVAEPGDSRHLGAGEPRRQAELPQRPLQRSRRDLSARRALHGARLRTAGPRPLRRAWRQVDPYL